MKDLAGVSLNENKSPTDIGRKIVDNLRKRVNDELKQAQQKFDKEFKGKTVQLSGMLGGRESLNNMTGIVKYIDIDYEDSDLAEIGVYNIVLAVRVDGSGTKLVGLNHISKVL